MVIVCVVLLGLQKEQIRKIKKECYILRTEIRISLMPPWDRCYDFLNVLAEKFSKKLAFLTQNKAK
jgi:hypothetical protein